MGTGVTGSTSRIEPERGAELFGEAIDMLRQHPTGTDHRHLVLRNAARSTGAGSMFYMRATSLVWLSVVNGLPGLYPTIQSLGGEAYHPWTELEVIGAVPSLDLIYEVLLLPFLSQSTVLGCALVVA